MADEVYEGAIGIDLGKRSERLRLSDADTHRANRDDLFMCCQL